MSTLIPTEYPSPPGQPANLAVINVITALGEAINNEAIVLAGEWAEASNMDEPNIFMIDKAKERIAQDVAGFINKMHPRAYQFSDAHASAYFGLAPTSNDRPLIK